MKADQIISAVTSVTKAWEKQRKAEEKNNQARGRRQYYYSDRVNFTDAANSILPAAYAKASGGGTFTVSQRQMYYAARESFAEKTGRQLEYNYFSQTLLRQYLNRNNVPWKITADPRGTFVLPNTAHEKRVPVGTLQIDDYLESRDEIVLDDIPTGFDIEWPSIAEGQRYAAVLYIEKEGFEPLMREAKIAERFNLAILSCKGQSVVAARKLVDHVCNIDGGVPLFVLHDFDKSGFEIAESLTQVSDWAEDADRVAYRFENEIEVTDLGLRLEDVEKYNLPFERCKPPRVCPVGATIEEAKWMASRGDQPKKSYSEPNGRRVELNAFTAPQFVEWLQGKLKKHLPKPFVPSAEIVEAAYRRAIAIGHINSEFEKIRDDATELAESATIPENIVKALTKQVKKSGEPWDRVLYEEIAKGNL